MQASQKLARVNGVGIAGRDLIAFRAADPPAQTMTEEMFHFLLERAIDRELVVQEARARRVQLTTEQEAQAAEVREQARARGVSDPAELDFEQREARVDLLQTALLAQKGTPTPLPNEADVQRYYDAHRDEFQALPSAPAERAVAWQTLQLQIRQRLATDSQRAYGERLRAYLNSLRTAANIARVEP